MRTCLVCHCTDADACVHAESGEPCHWVDPVVAVCSRCEDNLDALLARIHLAPCTIAELFATVAAEDHDEAARGLAFAIELGAVVLEGDRLHLVAEAVPPMEHVGTIGDCEVYSPGTFTAGEGWGPVRSDLAAVVSSAAASAPSIVVPFTPESKEPS